MWDARAEARADTAWVYIATIRQLHKAVTWSETDFLERANGVNTQQCENVCGSVWDARRRVRVRYV